MAMNQYFCLNSAALQRAKPFQIIVHNNNMAIKIDITLGSRLRLLANKFIVCVSMPLLYYNQAMIKLMSIDYGEKRVGIASTDESGTFALPRVVLPNTPDLLDKVMELKNIYKAEKIILGDSKNLDGKPNPISEKINQFKEALEASGVEVVLHPEVFTTMEAKQIQGQTDMTDASAASLILKSYIDSN